MSNLSLDHVQLAIPPGTEAQADAFYVGLLGFVVIPKPPALAARGGRWYESGATKLHLGVEEAFVPSTKAHVALVATSYDQLRTRLLEADVRVRDDEEIEGVDRFYTWDPFDNRLEIIRA